MSDKKTVAIDFDGVLAEFDGWNGPDHMGELIREHHPKFYLEKLRERGFYIIIYTCRSELEPVRDFLGRHSIPWDSINGNPYEPEGVSEKKIYADYYIDDRFPGFESLGMSVCDLLCEEGFSIGEVYFDE
ncbi:MAG: hypothetical protein ACOC55_01885 [Candidatus Natronoplasma sp.]